MARAGSILFPNHLQRQYTARRTAARIFSSAFRRRWKRPIHSLQYTRWKNQLVISNSTGGGTFGAGTILTLSADPAPSGQIFSQWLGTGVSNPVSPTTLFVMPAANATVTAIYNSLPAPSITGWSLTNGTSLSIAVQTYPNQQWILQGSTNLTDWIGLGTNGSDSSGLLQLQVPIDPVVPERFFRLSAP